MTMSIYTNFSRAARDGDLKTLSRCTRRDVNKRDQGGMTPVHWAASFGNIEGLRILIGKGGNPDKPNNEGCTALHLAAASAQLHCLVFLTNFGGNVYAVNDNGESPMQVAASKGRIKCVRHLETIITHQIEQDRGRVKKMQLKSQQDAEKRIKEKMKLFKKLDKEYDRKSSKDKQISEKSLSLTRSNQSRYNDVINANGSISSDNERKLTYSELLGMKESGDNVPTSEISNSSLRNTDDEDLILSELSEDILFENRFENGSLGNDTALSEDTATTNLANSKHSSQLDGKKYGGSFPAPNFTASINSISSASNGFMINSGQMSDSLDDGSFKITQEPVYTRSHKNNVIVQSVGNVPPSKRKGEPVGTADVHMGPLYTFLHVLELDELRETFLREKIDLRACLLCCDEDLKEIGLPLGQRKIVLNAIKKRNKTTIETENLVDSAV